MYRHVVYIFVTDKITFSTQKETSLYGGDSRNSVIIIKPPKKKTFSRRKKIPNRYVISEKCRKNTFFRNEINGMMTRYETALSLISN